MFQKIDLFKSLDVMAGASELGGFKIETNFKIFDTKCYCNYNKHKGSQGCIGDRGSSVVKVLCYKSEGGWFDPS